MKRLAVAVIAGIILGMSSLGCGNTETQKTKHLERGGEYLEQSRYKEAIIEFKNVIQIDPRSATAHYRLGIIYLRQKNIREGYRELTKCVEIDPDMMEAQLTLANIYLLARDFEKSQEKAEMILKEEPDNVTARLILANSYAGGKEIDKGIDEAIELLREVSKERPDFGKGHYYLGAGYLAKGKLQLAKNEMADTVEKDPSLWKANLALADIYLRRRSFDLAIEECNKVLKTASISAGPSLSGKRLFIQEQVDGGWRGI
jgi:Tfp pilus assembly protein PilF